MLDLWARIDACYASEPGSIRAEEVFALYCEGIVPGHHINRQNVHEHGACSFCETCIDRIRPMRLDDLETIALMVAQGLHDRSRQQQNFPERNQQLRQQRESEPMR